MGPCIYCVHVFYIWEYGNHVCFIPALASSVSILCVWSSGYVPIDYIFDFGFISLPCVCVHLKF